MRGTIDLARDTKDLNRVQNNTLLMVQGLLVMRVQGCYCVRARAFDCQLRRHIGNSVDPVQVIFFCAEL